MLKYSLRISIEVRLLSMMTALKGQTDFYNVLLKKSGIDIMISKSNNS